MRVKDIVLAPLRWIEDDGFLPVYRKHIVTEMVPLCDGDAFILDVGCDDGAIPAMMMEQNPSLHIVGVDIQALHQSQIPKTLYDGITLPYPDNCFDIVMAVDVLHHVPDIRLVLKEMRRVSKKYVLLKDQLANTQLEKYLVAVSDYVTNVGRDIKCLYNFPSEYEWRDYFQSVGLRVVEQPHKLYFGFGLDETYNMIVKLEK